MAERRQVEDGKAAASKPHVRSVGKSTIPHAGIVRSAMGLHARHARKCFPITAIHHATNAAHWLRRSPLIRCLNTQFVDLCLDMKKLNALQTAINQPRNAIEKAEGENVFVQKKQNRRSGQRKKTLPQPPPSLGLRSKQRRLEVTCVPLALKPHLRFPVRIFVVLADVSRKRLHVVMKQRIS